MKVLVAEDSSTIRKILDCNLQKAGYKVVIAENGIDAISQVYLERPDLIITDIEMPKMDGFQLVRFLKNNDETNNIPIIVLTAVDEESKRHRILRTGAAEYINKNFIQLDNIDELLIKIDNLKNQIESCHHNKKFQPMTKSYNEIFSNINAILDTQLFRVELLNDVHKISTDSKDFNNAMQGILKLFSRVLNYEISAIFVPDLNSSSLNIYIPEHLVVDNALILQIQNKILESSEKFFKKKISATNLKTEISGKYNSLPNLFGKEIKTFLLEPVESSKQIIALVALAHTKANAFLAEDIKELENLKAPIGLVLDNALMHKRTAELAITDGLTNLATHRHFQESLDREMGRAKRFKINFALILIDIDNFKHLNDTYGHLSGDKVLIEIANIMKAQTRETDIVARYGGEEFVIVVSESNKQGAVRIAERIRKTISEHKFILQEKEVPVTVSIGVSAYNQDGETKTEIISKADQALYKAKTTGKNKVCQA